MLGLTLLLQRILHTNLQSVPIGGFVTIRLEYAPVSRALTDAHASVWFARLGALEKEDA